MANKIDRFLLACGVIGAPLFLLSLFIFGTMFSGYNPLNEPISQLGAVDSPVKTLANVLSFNLFGILIILFAVGLFRSSELHLAGKIGAIFFFGAGVSMFLVGAFPCDALCTIATPTAHLHQKFSFYPFPIMTIGFLLFAFDVLANNKKLVWLVPIIITIGPLALGLRYFTSVWPPVLYPGLIQRAAIVSPFLIVMAIAMALYRLQVGRGAIFFTISLVILLMAVVGTVAGINSPDNKIPFLCPRNQNCDAYCQNSFGQCKAYCVKYPENPLCQKRFSFE